MDRKKCIVYTTLHELNRSSILGKNGTKNIKNKLRIGYTIFARN